MYKLIKKKKDATSIKGGKSAGGWVGFGKVVMKVLQVIKRWGMETKTS